LKPNHDLTNSVCQTCHLQNNKCTSKSNQKDDDTKQAIDKKKWNVEFGNDIQNILTSECTEHTDPCYCTFNLSNEYGYRSEYEFDANQQPTKSCLTKSDIFYPPVFGVIDVIEIILYKLYKRSYKREVI